jgi:hypothetical protein
VSGRYAASAQLTYVTASGAHVAYLDTRILPPGASVASAGVTAVRADELHRLDLVAFRTLGNAELAWRIADANDAMDPFELCARTGTSLRLPASQL